MVKAKPVGINGGEIQRAGDYKQQDDYQDVVNFGDECTPAVEAVIPAAVQQVLELLESLS